MADLGVFTRYKGFNDFQDEARKNDLAAALAGARIEKLNQPGGGGNIPAALQLANAYQERLAAGDQAGADQISLFAKIYDKGVLPPAAPTGLTLPNTPIPQATSSNSADVEQTKLDLFGQGNSTGANGAPPPTMQVALNTRTIPGYAGAVSSIAGAKKGAEEQAKSNVELDMKPKIKYNEKVAEGRGAATTKNTETLGNLDSMQSSIQQARALLPKVAATGPIMGRLGALAEDPDYRNLQGAVNSIVLQAKDLYNLGSGQGFTDADRNFLQEVISGKYARAETIGLGLDRMQQALEHRAAYLGNQNAATDAQYGGASPQLAPVEAKKRDEVNARKSGIKEGATATNPATGQKLTYWNGSWQ